MTARLVAVCATALVLTACSVGQDEAAPTEVEGLGPEPVCGFLDPEPLREALAPGRYEVEGLGNPARLERGRPTAGNCRVQTPEGLYAARVVVEHAQMPFAESLLRSVRGRETYFFPPSEGTGRAGDRGVTPERGGYAVLEADDYVVMATISAPRAGRDSAQDAVAIVRSVFADVIHPALEAEAETEDMADDDRSTATQEAP